MLAGTGGSETYTAGHVRELLRRGIKAQVVTVGHGRNDGRKDFADIPFLALQNASEISQLSGTVVFVNRVYNVPTKNKAAVILHYIPPVIAERQQRQMDTANKTLIATSIYSGQQWPCFWIYPIAACILFYLLPTRFLATCGAPNQPKRPAFCMRAGCTRKRAYTPS